MINFNKKTELLTVILTNIEDYFLALLHQDCQRKTAQAKLKELLQEGLNSEGESVTSECWQDLRMSILKT